MTDYLEKLKHPNWQKKRLEIMQRDDFKCCACSDSESTLHIHHLYYEKNNEPWEYPNNSLITLCASCHENEEVGYKSEAEKYLVRSVRSLGLLDVDVCLLADAFSCFGESQNQLRENDVFELAGAIQTVLHERIKDEVVS